MTAKELISKLHAAQSELEKQKLQKFFRGEDGVTETLGVRFGTVFKLAKEHAEMPLDEVEKLLEDKHYEIRMAAASILDFKVQKKNVNEAERKACFDLYLRRHERLNNWDFVDRAARRVIGMYLIDKPRDILYTLAASSNPWERRTAMVATSAFISKGDLDDTYNIAKILLHDKHELINKAVGTWLREAGKKDQSRLLTFLDKHAANMPRITLRYAVEKLDKKTKQYYMNI